MNIFKLNRINILTTVLLISVFAFSCSDDDHYKLDSSVLPDKNLMEVIKTNSQLSTFAALVEKVNYDKIL